MMQVLVNPANDDAIDASETMYPSRLLVVARAHRAFERVTSTVYGYVVSGSAILRVPALQADLQATTYFAVPGAGSLQATGVVVTIERFGFRGMLQIGRIEATGRLAYMDGCSDSVLVAPPRQGDPVLNHLHFPAGTMQSLHAHPSIRLGVVARGDGVAHGPSHGGWEQPLATGCVFLLGAHEVHAFKTEGGSMDVLAYHPDSDWGPTDAQHPMLNRTYVAKR